MTQPNDIDLDLDDLVHLENMFLEHGREDGLRDGKSAGMLEGFVLGSTHGFRLAQEVGFYKGVTETWSRIVSQYSGDSKNKSFNERTIKQLESLHGLIAQFPLENNRNVEVHKLLERIRAKYKVVMSLLNSSGNLQKFNDVEGSIATKISF
ncbi:2412_t:CDS:2 [Ambispora leptoticha]|uniref:2412_t:CDS:1 n=1 Tax=Ambispora leptoticha TaxID=144679 RepID=A0A9N9DJC6_9GLOM|nr:2412_t:CDS:2 [Ambispora leptoticha]